jgi:hypothetical protein
LLSQLEPFGGQEQGRERIVDLVRHSGHQCAQRHELFLMGVVGFQELLFTPQASAQHDSVEEAEHGLFVERLPNQRFVGTGLDGQEGVRLVRDDDPDRARSVPLPRATDHCGWMPDGAFDQNACAPGGARLRDALDALQHERFFAEDYDTGPFRIMHRPSSQMQASLRANKATRKSGRRPG